MNKSLWLSLALGSLLGACSGDDGPAGTPSILTATAAEPAGANCEFGGTAVAVGADTDDDGELAAGEVTSTAYVCNPESGGEQAPTLVTTEAVEPGDDCELGGTAVHVGADDDGDGELATDEIDSTSFVCNPTTTSPTRIEGDVFIRNSIDAMLLVGVEEITGTLIVDAGALFTLDLSTLASTGGLDLVAWGGPTLELPALTEVTGDVEVGNVALTAPLLAGIGGELHVAPGTVAVPELPALVTLARLRVSRVEVGDAPSFSLDVTSLEQLTIDGDVVVSLPELTTLGSELITPHVLSGGTSVDLPQLTTITGRFHLSGWRGDLALPALTTASDIDLEDGGPGLTTFAAPELTTVDTLRIRNNIGLHVLDLPALTAVTTALNVSTNGSAFETLSLPQLEESRTVQIVDQPSLTSLDLPVLTTAGLVDVLGTSLNALTFPALVSVGTLHTGSNFSISSLSMPMLTSADALLLSEDPLTSVSLPLLETVAQLSPSYWQESFELPSLVTLGSAYVPGNATTISLPLLETVTGSLEFSTTIAPSIALPSLERVDGRLWFGKVYATSLSLPALTEVGDLEIDQGNFVSVSFPALTTAHDIVVANQFSSLTSLAFPALTTAHRLQVSATYVLTTLTAPMLSSVAELFLAENYALPNCQATAILDGSNAISWFLVVNDIDACPPTCGGTFGSC